MYKIKFTHRIWECTLRIRISFLSGCPISHTPAWPISICAAWAFHSRRSTSSCFIQVRMQESAFFSPLNLLHSSTVYVVCAKRIDDSGPEKRGGERGKRTLSVWSWVGGARFPPLIQPHKTGRIYCNTLWICLQGRTTYTVHVLMHKWHELVHIGHLYAANVVQVYVEST